MEIHGSALPSQEKIRADIHNCVCPFCGKGPFKAVAMHVSQAHDINRHKLRELAGMTTNESLASPEYSAQTAKRAKESGSVAYMAGYVERIKNSSRPLKLSEAGRAKQQRTMRGVNEQLTPDERSARAKQRSAAQAPESRKKQAASLKAWHASNPLAPEAKAAKLAALNTPEAKRKLAEAAARRRQPCGTEAAYSHRKCRCEPCKSAKREARARRKLTTANYRETSDVL